MPSECQAKIFHNGAIVTMDDNFPSPEAIGIVDGNIESVGSLDKVVDTLRKDAILVDLKGRTLLPGFIDAHSHILGAALTLGAPVIDVRPPKVPSYKALLSKIRRKISSAKPGEYYLFFGLDPQLHPDAEHPSRELLDLLAPANPVGIQSSNCHALYLNSLGFESCGINKSTPTPPGSIIDRDEEGNPTGRIAEAVTKTALNTFYYSWGKQRLNREFESTINEFIRNGITTTTEHLYLPFYESYYRAALEQGLPMPRIVAYQRAVGPDMLVQPIALGNNRMWIAGVKIHADGSPFVGNIWISEPYLESEISIQRMNLAPGHTGETNYPADYFEEMVRTYFLQGWQMSVHTQGDRTIDMVLDIVENILKESDKPDHRFRLEHCALMRPDQIERAMRLGVLCSFFINHIPIWGAPIEDALFGPERAARYMPVGTAVRSGMTISLHADTPMTNPNCLGLMEAAVTRRAGDGRCLGQEECIEVEAALRAVTIDAAYHIGSEKILGSISPGKCADLVVLGQNPLGQPGSKIGSIEVQATYLAGERVFEL